MMLLLTESPAESFLKDPLAIPVFSDVRPPQGEAGRVDLLLNGRLSKWLATSELDPRSDSPLIFAPGQAHLFPEVLVMGAGEVRELTEERTQETIAAMVETFLRAGAPSFGVAAGDLKKSGATARESARAILRGILKGCDRADVHAGHTVRIHWERGEAHEVARELKRFRPHLPPCRDWEIQAPPGE